MYFENFPLTYYSVDDGANVKVVTNITVRAVINDEVKNNYSLYDEYDIKDGETPEILADKFYRNSTLHWIILHVNEILDPRYDWPLTTKQLNTYVSSKYANPEAVHHYEDAFGNWVNSNYPSAAAISNFVYEDRLNEEKRRIKILKANYVNSVVSDFIRKIQA